MKVLITATETIEYRRSFELEELEAQAGATLEDIQIAVRSELPGRPESVIEATAWERFKGLVLENHDDGFQERLERHGDVQGQEWDWTVINEGDEQ